MIEAMFGHDCPLCGGKPLKAFYAGFPLKMCEDCNCAFGFFCWIFDVLPFIGGIITYEGSYWALLWDFIKGDLKELEQ